MISNPEEREINPAGGLVRYGVVKSEYILISGSVPGPKKRLIRFTTAIRPKLKFNTQVPDIQEISLRSQQG